MLKKYFRYLRSVASEMYESDILNLIEPDPNACLLDIGCDNGRWTGKIISKVGCSIAFGIDVVEEALNAAHQSGIGAVKCNVSDNLPFNDGAFDIVHSNQVIEHLYRTEHFVREIFRVLKPGGYAVICTENLASWHNIFSLVMGWMPMSSSNFSQAKYNIGNPLAIHSSESAYLPESWQHIRVLSVRGIKDIFELHGFKMEKFLGAGYYPFPSSIARIDPTHAAFMTCKFRKPKLQVSFG